MIFLTAIFLLAGAFYITRRLDRRAFNADLARQADERRQLLDQNSAGHQAATMVIDMQQAARVTAAGNPPPPAQPSPNGFLKKGL